MYLIIKKLILNFVLSGNKPWELNFESKNHEYDRKWKFFLFSTTLKTLRFSVSLSNLSVLSRVIDFFSRNRVYNTFLSY